MRPDATDSFRAFPDLTVTVRSTPVAGNRYALEARFTGTPSGPLISADGEIPAKEEPWALPPP